MPRGIPWDELPNVYHKDKGKLDNPLNSNIPPVEVDITPKEVDYSRDAVEIARRIAFGGICGSITGAAFGAVEVVRDPKMMKTGGNLATMKVLKTGGMFAAFFGAYHGVRKTLHLYNPQPPEVNVGIAAAITLAPLVAVPKFRGLLPYGVIMIILDAVNGVDA